MDPTINSIEPRSRLTRVFGLLAGMLAICALIGAGSAAAATQHWASGHPTPFGKSQAFTGKSLGEVVLTWKFGGGSTVEIGCSGGASASGSVENPSSGAAGTLTSTGLQFTGCMFPGYENECKVHNGEIKFNALTASVYTEAGKQVVDFKPASGANLATVQVENGPRGCAINGAYALTGDLPIYRTAEFSPGEFWFVGTVAGTHLQLGGYALAYKGAISLSNSSAEQLLLGAEATPHWYIGSAAWNDLANGKPQSVSSGESLSLNLSGKLFGAKVEFACSGSGDKLEGLAENESPGGAAKSSATLSLGHCVALGEFESRCSVEVTTLPLSAAVMATPAIQLSPAEGKKLMTMNVKQIAGGKSCAIVGSNLAVTGKLLATSFGEGRFAVSGNKETELAMAEASATANGSMALEDSLGEFLRLQEV